MCLTDFYRQPNSMSASLEARNTLRKQFRAKRNHLGNEQQQIAAQQILAQCLKNQVFADANTIACYLSNDGEIDPYRIIEYCWQQHKNVLLPVLDPNLDGHLIFVKYQASTELIANKYGIPEPRFDSAAVCNLVDIDLIFTPLVAFDSKGNRLGMGGGYYDRTLATLSQQAHSTQVFGLAHTCQQSESLPAEKWDFPVHAVISPKQIFTF